MCDGGFATSPWPQEDLEGSARHRAPPTSMGGLHPVCPGANVLATPSKVINGDGDGGHLSILGRWRSALNTTFTGAAVLLWLWGG